jgi:hypothetical protein
MTQNTLVCVFGRAYLTHAFLWNADPWIPEQEKRQESLLTVEIIEPATD